MTELKAKIIKSKVNLSTRLFFQKDSQGRFLIDPFISQSTLRVHQYTNDKNIVINFPLIFHPQRLKECLEMNLFLRHRATGAYSTERNNKTSESVFSDGYYATLKSKGVEIITLEKIADDLKMFITWLHLDGSTYEELVAAPLAKDSVREDVQNMPLWKFRTHLRERVIKKTLSWKTANRILGNIIHFYLWSHKRGRIIELPFSAKFELLRRRSKEDDTLNNLFSLPTPTKTRRNDRGHWNLVTNFKLSNADKQKTDIDHDLQPYSIKELKALLETNEAQKPLGQLYLQCAFLGGLRSFELGAISYQDIFDPSDNLNKGKIPKLSIIRKGKKPVVVMISSYLMRCLYNHTLTQRFKNDRIKHETKYGINNTELPLPLFMNGRGQSINSETPSRVVIRARKELSKKGIIFKRNYHDLRATYCTYIVKYLLSKGETEARIKATIIKLMSHENFKTTEIYINFAKLSGTNAFGEMYDWVKDIYEGVTVLAEQVKANEI